MNPYTSLSRNPYTNDDVAAELRRSGGGQETDISSAYANYAPTSQVNYGMFGSSAMPMDAYPSQAPPPPPAMSSQGYTQMTSGAPKDIFDQYARDGRMTRAEFERAMASYGESQHIDPKMLEGAVDVKVREGRVVSERMIEQRSQVIAGVKPVYTVEKVVEVPQVIVREHVREVLKPEVVERIIEVPKMEINERKVVGPPQVQYQEQIVEVPQVVIEERVTHVPRREVQERLIEVPKVEYVERIEYEDFIEYREVPVDKIIEVPEIEYRIREVEYLVPQTYIQEYYVDRYKEFPVTQVQEVERTEHVPVEVSAAAYQQYMSHPGYVRSASMAQEASTAPAQILAQPAQRMAAPMQSAPMAQQIQTVPYGTMPNSSQAAVALNSQVQMGASYMTYGGSSTRQGQPVTVAQPQTMASGVMQPAQAIPSYATYDPNAVIAEANRLFDALDKNGDGFLTKQELHKATQSGSLPPMVSTQLMGSMPNMQSMTPVAMEYSAMSPMASGAMTPPMAPGYNPYTNPFASNYPGPGVPVQA